MEDKSTCSSPGLGPYCLRLPFLNVAVKNICLAQAPPKVTDPRNMLLAGVPPKDLIEDVAQALIGHGIDVDKYFEDACKVTRDWEYDRSKARVLDRIQQRYNHERSIPLKRRSLAECLNPQPEAHV